MKKLILSILLAISLITTAGATTLGFLTSPVVRFWNSSGTVLLTSGKVVTCQPGTSCGCTSFTPLTTYTDSTGATPNTNPVILDANGNASIWYSGLAKITVCSSTNVVQWTRDNVASVLQLISTSPEWVAVSVVPSFLSSTSFSVPGDYTSVLTVGRRLQITQLGGVVYSTVVSTTFSTGATTIVVANDSAVLNSGISAINVGIMEPTYPSLPIKPTKTKIANYTITNADNGYTILSDVGTLATFTVTQVNPAVFTTPTAHGLIAGKNVGFTTTGYFPNGIQDRQLQTYYVIATGLTATNFEVSTTVGGSAISAATTTCTITIATPAVITTGTTTHNYAYNDPVVFATTGALPTGITAGTTYYVFSGATSTTFEIMSSPSGTAINTSGTQSGEHTVKRVASGTHTVNNVITFTLPAASTVSNGFNVKLKNINVSVPTISGTIDGTSTYTLNQYSTLDIFSNGTSWYSNPSSFLMTGEMSATSNTNTTSLNLGNVVAGDRIFVYAICQINPAFSAGSHGIRIVKESGTATFIIGHSLTEARNQFLNPASVGDSAMPSLSCIIKVTGSGTLTIHNFANGGASYSVNEIYAFFLKKQ